jgi:hypothetical protein
VGRPISKNSAFQGLSIRRFEDIHEETSPIVFSRKQKFSRNLVAEKEMKSRGSSVYRW